jgi:ribosomal protein L11 methyltransferase
VSKSKEKSAKISDGSATYVARLVAGEAAARRIADLLSESLDPTDSACAAFEQPDGRWQVDVHFRERPDEKNLRAIIAMAGGDKLARAMSVQKVAPRNKSQRVIVAKRKNTEAMRSLQSAGAVTWTAGTAG